MKTKFTVALALLLVTLLVACGATSLWDSATYLTDTTVGNGAKTVTVSVEAEEKAVTITLKTDKATLGEALYEQGLINDPSFFDTLNGMKADWNATKTYWAFYQGDEYMPVGVNETAIEGGESYRFVLSK